MTVFGNPYATDPSLIAAVEKARAHRMTLLEAYEQRVSWIYGEVNMNRPDHDLITREEIGARLLEQGIGKPSA